MASNCSGIVFIQVENQHGVISEYEFKNTVLISGRRKLAMALSGNSGKQFDAYISHIAFGNGGTNSGVIIPVDETMSTFVGGSGNIIEIVPASCSMLNSIGTTIVVTATVPNSKAFNVDKFDQVGLMLASGDMYAIATWNGADYNKNVGNTIKWNVTI